MLMGRMLAGVDLLGRTGVGEVEIAYDDDLPEPATVLWWCGGNWKGTRMFSAHFSYPAQAVEDLLSRVINGGGCTRCKRTTVLGVEIEGYCCFMLEAAAVDDDQSYRYVRTCERAAYSEGRAGEATDREVVE
jgi:hypothetical protein